jgi:carbonic anhydrase/acetyltransferase-like protein (isoleucine patch superfamily)
MKAMIIEHDGALPRIHETAFVAPTAVICGDVEIGADCCIMYGAVIVASEAPVVVGARTVVMENSVVRSWPSLPVTIGHDVHLGIGSSVQGALVGDNAFVAHGAMIYPRAEVGAGTIVRANALVHVGAVLPENRRVPDGWTAIGDPAQVVPPGPDERMLVAAEGMNFTKAIFGVGREQLGLERYLELLQRHRDDVVVDPVTNEP